MEAAPTCFGLQRNHHQGATASAQLKLQDWFSVDIDVVSAMAAQNDCDKKICIEYIENG